MLEKEIVERVKEHYATSKEPLLLSDFGKTLRFENVWPSEGEKRGLREVIEELKSDVRVVRDPKAPAYAIVVDKEHEDIANEAIKARADTVFHCRKDFNTTPNLN